MKKYIELQNPTRNATHLKIEVYYTKGGYNLFTYKEETRGYYLSVSPVGLHDHGGFTSESYTAFSGKKFCVHPVTRKSEKAEKIAIEKASQIEKQLIDYVCNANGIAIVEGEKQ